MYTRCSRALCDLSRSVVRLCEARGPCLPQGSGHAWSTDLVSLVRPSRLLTVGLAQPQQCDQYHQQDASHSIQSELTAVSERIREAVTSEIPALQQAASYFFLSGSEGKRIRPSICLLLSSALANGPPPEDQVLKADLRPVGVTPSELRRRQQRIAEISELIHVASLLHDDVIDDADSRRGKPALNHVLGNKVAILAGDFLLARASMTLASLQNTSVVTLMSQILEDLVSGTAIGRATACDSQACGVAVMDLAWRAQVTDDMLDFTSKGSVLGKPALNDVKAGVITCPLLFAAEEHPELLPVIKRKLSKEGDVEVALKCLHDSRGIARSLKLANEYASLAVQNLDMLGPSPSKYAEGAREILRQMCHGVVTRTY